MKRASACVIMEQIGQKTVEKSDGRNADGSPECTITKSAVPNRVSETMKVAFLLDYEYLSSSFITGKMLEKAECDEFLKNIFFTLREIRAVDNNTKFFLN